MEHQPVSPKPTTMEHRPVPPKPKTPEEVLEETISSRMDQVRQDAHSEVVELQSIMPSLDQLKDHVQSVVLELSAACEVGSLLPVLREALNVSTRLDDLEDAAEKQFEALTDNMARAEEALASLLSDIKVTTGIVTLKTRFKEGTVAKAEMLKLQTAIRNEADQKEALRRSKEKKKRIQQAHEHRRRKEAMRQQATKELTEKNKVMEKKLKATRRQLQRELATPDVQRRVSYPMALPYAAKRRLAEATLPKHGFGFLALNAPTKDVVAPPIPQSKTLLIRVANEEYEEQSPPPKRFKSVARKQEVVSPPKPKSKTPKIQAVNEDYEELSLPPNRLKSVVRKKYNGIWMTAEEIEAAKAEEEIRI